MFSKVHFINKSLCGTNIAGQAFIQLTLDGAF